MASYAPMSYYPTNPTELNNEIPSHSNIPNLHKGLISPEIDYMSIKNEQNLPILKSPPFASKSVSFNSKPYPTARRRRTEPSFSFEMGPIFTTTKQSCELLSMDQTNSYQVQLNVKMDRGFFKAEGDWTCYRRNYFQVSSTFDLLLGNTYLYKGTELPCLMRHPENQSLIQVDYFSIGIGARIVPDHSGEETSNNNNKRVELIQHTPKRDKGPQMVPEPRPVRAGGNLHLAPMGPNHHIVTFERLQFKTATANNGKRRAAQQYYEIVVDLYANSSRSMPVVVASSVSAPLVVRGRSPGHYADSPGRFDLKSPVHPPVGFGSTHDTIYGAHKLDTTSLPNSPLSELGPYSPFQPYPSYSTSALPSFSQHPTSNLYLNHQPVSHHNSPYYENSVPIHDHYAEKDLKNQSNYWPSQPYQSQYHPQSNQPY